MGNEARRTNKETATIGKTTKEGKTYGNWAETKDPKNTTAVKSNYTTGRNKSKEGRLKRFRTGLDNKNKTGHCKIPKKKKKKKLPTG